MTKNQTLICPECKKINEHKFIHDIETIEQYGFNASKTQPAETSDEEWAPNGLCPSTTCIDEWCAKRNLDSRFKMGIPLIEEETEQSDVIELQFESAEECECNLGKFFYNPEIGLHVCDNPHCAEVRKDLPKPQIDAMTGNLIGDKGFKFQNDYSKALGFRKEVVEPPYLAVQSINPMTLNWNKIQAKKEQEEFSTSTKRKQFWFTCLQPYLMALEGHTGTRFQKIVLSTYIDKTFEFRHIEPLWMFAKRGRLGGELRAAFGLFDDKLEVFSDVINTHEYALENNIESIRCVYQLIKSTGSWPADRIDDEKMISQALKSKEKLDSQLKKLVEFDLMNNHYSLNGRVKTPIGLIECICIINALHHHSGIENFANDIRNQIFPNKSNSEFWKEIMGEKSELFVNRVLAKFCSL